MAGLNLNVGGYAGLGMSAGGAQPQVPVPPQPQYQNYPYAYGSAYPSAPAPAPVPSSTQHHNSGTQTIGGKTEQSGTFKGHGTGASIQGGFTASGSIA